MPDFAPFSTPHQPPRLSRNEAKASTTIAQRGIALPLRLGDTRWHVDLRPTATQPLFTGHWALAWEWVGAEFQLQLPKSFADEIAAPLLANTHLPELPPELAQATLEAALAESLGALTSLGRGTPRLLSMTQDALPPESSPHSFSLEFRAASGTAAISAMLYADSLGLLVLAGLVGKRKPAPGVLDDQLLLRLPAEIGYTRLPADELQSLASGDVVLMDTCHLGAERTLCLSADGLAGLIVHLPPALNVTECQDAFHHSTSQMADLSPEDAPDVPAEPSSATDSRAAQPAAPTLTVIQAWNSLMPPEEPSSQSTASLAGVPIRMSFDLGEVSMTVAEARALQPGQAISLARPLAGVVRIRANGALVGEGDLVEIDGQLGVSIRTLFPASAQEAE
ncbi:MAG: type III secretion system cytoplasmic ring protein SctQ [Comamonadaceae bacterium]|nr:type III secretion system cytoplasmic ring protein SctQ [Comamonadaceae bacterium]